MEESFGQSFDHVQVHTGEAADDAARSLNARAFTNGNDVYFARSAYNPGTPEGEHLLAHELAHVVQGGGAPAARSSGGPSVSHPGDATEIAADRAADAVVRGEPVPGLGPGGSGVHRDALGDLDEISEGSLFGVDEDEALETIGRLGAADKRKLALDAEYRPIVRRLCQAFNASEMKTLFTHVYFPVRWKLFWLAEAGVLDDIDEGYWRWFLGYTQPSEMAELRQSSREFALFLEHAPADLIPPWDKLEGLANGSWSGDAGAIRNAVNQLSEDQKQEVRADKDKMLAIVRGAGDAGETFRTVAYLDTPLTWAVYWLIRAGMIAELGDQEWAQMLAEAPKSEFDALVAYGDGWERTREHCPAHVLQIVRQQTSDEDQTETSLDDPVQIETLLASLGSAGFLALATRRPEDVATNYGKIKSAGKVAEVLDGLEVGPKLGARTAANLRAWFFESGEGDIPTLERMFSVRFRVTAGGKGSKDHETDHEGNPTGRDIQPWNKNGLEQSWEVMERLPPASVEQNERFVHLLRNQASGVGNAYYSGTRNGAEGDAVMGALPSGQEPDGGVAGEVDTRGVHGSSGFQALKFNTTLRHEIGHAVDAQLGIMEGWRGQPAAGGWIKYGSWEEFVDSIIASSDDGMSGYPDPELYRDAMIKAVSEQTSFSSALTALGGTPPASPGTGPIATVWEPRVWTDEAGGPWYHPQRAVAQGGRNFQSAYKSVTSLYSYLADERANREVTEYQWRAPGEWFAEVYQVYYAEQEQGPDRPVGGLLRQKDPQAAAMVSNIVDRGYSPQAVRGGGRRDEPGTGNSR